MPPAALLRPMLDESALCPRADLLLLAVAQTHTGNGAFFPLSCNGGLRWNRMENATRLGACSRAEEDAVASEDSNATPLLKPWLSEWRMACGTCAVAASAIVLSVSSSASTPEPYNFAFATISRAAVLTLSATNVYSHRCTVPMHPQKMLLPVVMPTLTPVR